MFSHRFRNRLPYRLPPGRKVPPTWVDLITSLLVTARKKPQGPLVPTPLLPIHPPYMQPPHTSPHLAGSGDFKHQSRISKTFYLKYVLIRTA